MSKPIDISSMKRVLIEDTIIFPVVTLLFSPPEIPLIKALPIMVSAQISRPRIYNSNMQAAKHKNWKIIEKNTTTDEKAFNMHDSAKIVMSTVKSFIKIPRI